MAAAFIIILLLAAFLCMDEDPKHTDIQHTHTHAHLFDTAGVLLHGYLFHGALKAEEGLDVQTGRLLETRPVLVLRVNLRGHTQNIPVTHGTHEQRQDDGRNVPTVHTHTHPASLESDVDNTHRGWGHVVGGEAWGGGSHSEQVRHCVCLKLGGTQHTKPFGSIKKGSNSHSEGFSHTNAHRHALFYVLLPATSFGHDIRREGEDEKKT